MASTMRWRYGDTSPVILPVGSAYLVEIGDLMYMEGDDARPASAINDQGTLVANQELFHDKFIGVAMQRSLVGNADSIRIATSGVFEFDCQASTFEVGDFIGANEEGTGTQLEEQGVAGVATPNLAIGRCVKRVPSASTRVLVDIVSTVVKGGPQAAA